MYLKRGFKSLAACLVFNALVVSYPSYGDVPYIEASPRQLLIEGWQIILPEVRLDEKGQTWVKYNLPDGSYQSYPLATGEPIIQRWVKNGSQELLETPPGYSIEHTDEIIDWWKNGGNGIYYSKDGKMVPATPKKQNPTGTKPGADPCDGKSPTGNPFDPCGKVKLN